MAWTVPSNSNSRSPSSSRTAHIVLPPPKIRDSSFGETSSSRRFFVPEGGHSQGVASQAGAAADDLTRRFSRAPEGGRHGNRTFAIASADAMMVSTVLTPSVTRAAIARSTRHNPRDRERRATQQEP
jgi:hypothetical protein